MASSWWIIEEKEEARRQGKEEGLKEGEKRMAQLFRKLKEADRENDMMKAVFDEEYRSKVYGSLEFREISN